MEDGALANAQDYYGKVLGSSGDLRTDACTTAAAPPPHVRRALERVRPEVSARYFGCGVIAPEEVEGARILDLGCGAGHDVYVLAQLAGESGAIVGVDATGEQLVVARRHAEWHRQKFEYERLNASFVQGDITLLDRLGFDPASFDIIVSNCAVNLVEDKAAVFAAAQRLLKPGGEFYFSDVYADRRAPRALRADPVLHGECQAGALYWNDFPGLARDAGFRDPRLVADRALAVLDASIQKATGSMRFFSATYRLFNIAGLEPACEDYGQAVVYRGYSDVFVLDKHHRFETNKVVPVCGNTWRMLADTRFARHFDFIGDFSTHFGIFENCGLAIPFDGADPGAAQTWPAADTKPPMSTLLDRTAKFADPDITANGEARAEVAFKGLKTLWVNTGTLCNITCAHCYIESSPTNDRLVYFTVADLTPFLDEAEALAGGPIEIGFTGGEPFLNPHVIGLAQAALARGHRVLILTNAMRPMMRPRVCAGLLGLRDEHRGRLTLRVSLDSYMAERHDEERGAGAFAATLKGIDWLVEERFEVSLAGRTLWNGGEAETRAGYARLIAARGWLIDAADPGQLVLFPEMDETADVPEITTACWGILGVDPGAMMCANARMVVKRKGASAPAVLACTLIPYDQAFELGPRLADALAPVKLNHRHCATFCVLGGGSCSA